MYCPSKACPWRCSSGGDAEEAVDENAEIPLEDQANLDMEDMGDEGDDDIDAETERIAEGMSELGPQPERNQGHSVRLFPSAHGVKWHESVLGGIANAGT